MAEKHTTFKQYVVTGIFALLPLVITLWVAEWALGLAWDLFFAIPVSKTRGVLTGMVSPDLMVTLTKWLVPEAISLCIVIFLVAVVGFVARQILGKALLNLMDKLINYIPGVNFIYSTIRQFISTMDPESSSRDAFRQAVLVKMGPHWTFGFVTSHSVVKSAGGRRFSTVFFPGNQVIYGFNVLVEEKNLVPLEMSVDEAMKYIISFGMNAPKEMVPRRLKAK